MTAFYTTKTPAKAPAKCCSNPDCVSKGQPLPLTEFGSNASSPDGKHWYCRNCNNAKQREWKRNNPKKVRAWKADYDERQRRKHRKGRRRHTSEAQA